ncbi:MAG: metalloregulator ArsR/SmtB family transcription factor [Actinomycetota bacterium]|nr:metalloregulator ArsR/SmtB family transcription factor [Actinomycetota bacterium]
MDTVFRALADPNRRHLLDQLRHRNGQSLHELCSGLDIARQSVTKHIAVLERAGLVTTLRQGREKWHYLNAAPINDIADRWISRYHRERTHVIADLKRALEESTVSQTDFLYVTYIRTTPEKLWQALTDPSFIRRYFEGGGPQSDWQVGSPIRWKMSADDESHDWDQRVLEAEPYRRLSYTWHTYQPEMAALFGWSDEELAELQTERRSKVTFEIEPAGAAVKLTVFHDDFELDSEMLKGISQGWPMILSNLKSVLEIDETLSLATQKA